MTNQTSSALRRRFCFVLLYLVYFSAASAQDLVQTPVTTNVNYAIGGYYQCLPLDYETSPAKKFPLLLFIHGIGELGDGSPDELPRILKHGPPELIHKKVFPNSFTVNGQTSSFIIISPQFRANYRDPAAVSSLIDYCIAKYHVDESRIYLTGLSMGGGISWVYAGKSTATAKRIAALLVVAANAKPGSGGVTNIVSANLPVWITHNDGDPVVTASNSIKWEKALNSYTPAINPKTRLDIFHSTSHNAWSKTYNPSFKPNGVNVYEWMLLHKRGDSTTTNQAPAANAGNDLAITLPTSSVTLAGTGTDADGNITQYAWTKVSGPDAGVIDAPAKASTTVSGLAAGTYTYRLTVKDDNGVTGVDDVNVTVNAEPNKPPVANAGNDSTITLPLDSVRITGEGSDADGQIASYLWTKISGPEGSLMDAKNAPQVSISGLMHGMYIFRLTVTDDKGATATDDVTIVVNAEKPAVVKAGTDTLVYKNQTRPDTVVLNGLASIGGTKYLWTKVSGPGQTTIEDATAPFTIAVGLDEGTHVFKLTIDGKWSDTIKVVMRDWQKKNVSPCRPGGGKSFLVPESYPGQHNHLYINRDNLLGERVMGGDTLYFKGGKCTAFEIGDFGGGEGCPVYIMPKDEALVITDGYFRIGVKDSNVVQHVVLDGTVLRSKNIPYGFFIDNRNVPDSENNYSGLVAGWVSNFTVKGYRSIKTGIMQIKLDAKKAPYGRYDKFIQKRIKIQDNFIDGSTAEGMYIGHTASNGGQLNNPYGPPPRMDSVEISDNIVMNTGWDGIQLANARTAAVIRHNLVYKTGLRNRPSQRAGILMGGNTTGIVDSNLVYNAKGNGIQVFGYSAVKVHGNIIDSIYGSAGDQDGMYQSHIAVVPETYNIPLSVDNFGNLISRVERKGIRIANNSRTMIPGHTYYNTFIDPEEKNAANLINANAADVIDHNEVLPFFPIQVNEISTKKGALAISITQGEATETFSNVKEAVDWLFRRLQSVGASNEPPVANAGASKTITLPLDSVTLTGSGADVDGSVTSYQWKQLSGPAGACIRSATKAKTKVVQLTEGIYKFELTVTDNGKKTDKDTVTITVVAAKPPAVNSAPEVFAGTNMDITLPVHTATLKGMATDKDGTIKEVKWTKISGPEACVFENKERLQTTVDSLTEGVYVFVLSATDNEKATSTDTVEITVIAEIVITPSNGPPVAVAGADQTIQLPVNSTTLEGTGMDADGTIESYLWEQIGSGKAVLKNQNAATAIVSSLTEGSYLFALTVLDNRGAAKSDTVAVTVLAKVNKPPLAYAGDDLAVQLPENAVVLNGKGADEDGFIERYQWRQLNGPVLSTITGAALAQAQVPNLKAGSYVFEFYVTDNEGATAKDTVQVLVKAAVVIPNKKPVAYAGNDLKVQLPQNTAVLSGSGLDEDGSIESYQWQQLSGPANATLATSSEAQATASSLVQGIYQFEIRVTDDKNAWDADTVFVTVEAPVVVPNKAPAVRAGNDVVLTLPANKATVEGTATDSDGVISSVQWTKIAGPEQYSIVKPQAQQTEIVNLGNGIYKFEFKAADNNGAVSRDTLQITVQPSITRPMFVMNAGDDKVITLPTDSVELKGVVDDPYQTGKTYRWEKVSGPSQYTFSNADAAQTTVTGLTEGVYLFVCKATGENKNILRDTVQVTVKLRGKSSATIFPNPASNFITIKIEANTRATNTVVVVHDLNGRVMYAETFMRKGGELMKQLDISKLPKGIYTVQVGTDINTKTALKLVKQ